MTKLSVQSGFLSKYELINLIVQANEDAGWRNPDRQIGLDRGHQGERGRPRKNPGHQPKSHLALSEHAKSLTL